jgi:hypothetical protein
MKQGTETMQNLYLNQPVLSSSDVADFLRKSGLNFAEWPQSVLPDEMIQSLDTGTESDMDMLIRNSAEFVETPEQYRAQLLKDNRAPRAVLRTSWGLLIGEKMEAGEESGFNFARYSVEVHCTHGWNNPSLGSYCDACMALLNESLSSFMYRNRTIEIEMDDASGDGIFQLSVFVSRNDQPDMENEMADGLLRYLTQIFEDGTMDEVIEAGCTNGTGRPRPASNLSGTSSSVDSRLH